MAAPLSKRVACGSVHLVNIKFKCGLLSWFVSNASIRFIASIMSCFVGDFSAASGFSLSQGPFSLTGRHPLFVQNLFVQNSGQKVPRWVRILVRPPLLFVLMVQHIPLQNVYPIGCIYCILSTAFMPQFAGPGA